MKSNSFFIVILILVVFISLLIPQDIWAQCPMCRMSAEANLKDGGSAAKGLNAGIMYMLSFPYILMSTIGFIWYRNRKKVAEAEQEAELRSLLEPLD